jgi:lipopolysaccharide/colanic/teichoic acid biosynthesis glycosyltransferase
VDAPTLGPGLTQKNDVRITRAGRILRWLKIDELPQLINVMKGEMSFVGPRPEIPSIVDLYSERQRKVLSVRPGLVGPSQVQWRHEVEQYPEGTNSEKFYIEYILPEKLQTDLSYVDNASFCRDLYLFFAGIFVTIIGALGMKAIFKGKKIG